MTPDRRESERLVGEVGVLAGRLARFLEASLSPSEGPLAGGVAFLHAMAVAARPGGVHEDDGWPSPLNRLVHALALLPAERDLLLLSGLAEEHEGYAAVLRTLHPHGEPYPSAGLAAQFLCRDRDERQALRGLLEGGSLVAAGALRLTGDAPLYERSLRTAEALWSVLHGLDTWPESVSTLPGRAAAYGLDEWLASPDASPAIKSLERETTCTVLVTADHEEIAFQRALALTEAAGRTAAGVAFPAGGVAGLERLIGVHALARGAIPVLRLTHVDGPTASEAPSFGRFPGAVVFCGRTGCVTIRGRRPLVAVAAEPMTAAARRAMWSLTLPELAGQAGPLARRYPLEPSTADDLAADLRHLEALEERPLQFADVAHATRARSNLALATGVRLLRPRATFDSLVLPRDRLARLHEAIERLTWQWRVFDEWGFLDGRPGTRGVRLLFSGPSGTGKTLAAEVLAGELGVDLLIVDVSRVVSKWLGETEKNLAAVFDSAERAHAVLFFDEADSLFSKRTQVSDAHDRYANLETAYLLSRLERFEGLAVLATNLRQNLDQAFLRRLEFVLEFDEPGREERRALWRCHLPPGAPLAGDVDLDELAGLYPVVGGVIRNATVAAGFRAAADGGAIQRRHFVHALRREYEKVGKAFPGPPSVINDSPPR
jgi:hypothetical protein